MNLFQIGNFTLNSGAKSGWKLECDALTDEDIKALALMIKELVGSFASVEGVPTGGLRLAEALRPYQTSVLLRNSRHLIVDDVLTTGGSMQRIRDVWLQTQTKNQEDQCIGAVIFARGKCPPWITPLFQMPEVFWLKPRMRGM